VRVAHVVVEVDMHGVPGSEGRMVTYSVPVQRAADFALVAARFCSARGVGNAECEEYLVARTQQRFNEADDRTAKLAARVT
jgi:hypothetical protein